MNIYNYNKMEKVIENIKVWDDLINSLKKKRSKKICKYIFQKGKKSGQNCPIHIDEAYEHHEYCCKHSKYNNQQIDDDLFEQVKKNTIVL